MSWYRVMGLLNYPSLVRIILGTAYVSSVITLD